MKGLLIKDFKMVKAQKRFFFLIITIAILLAFGMNNISFLYGYLGFMLPNFAVSTIGYDEYNNGSSFLFTLPITRADYVAEKYILIMLLGAMSVVLDIIITITWGFLRDISVPERLAEIPIILSFFFVILSIMVPIQLKFGSEKGRFAFAISIGIIILLGFAVLTLTNVAEAGFNIDSLPSISITTIAIGIAITALVTSYAISLRTMNKKEF